MPKILVLDIEFAPTKAYVWKAWDENISEDQIIKDGGILCVGVKWLHAKRGAVYSDWDHGHIEMLTMIRDLIDEADAIVTYNGDRYDLPKLEGEFILHGIDLPAKTASIDLIKTVKKLKYFRSSLKYVSSILGIGGKLEHEGFKLWRKVLEGDVKAQNKMSKYCEQDVLLTERLYHRILPAIRNHPNLGFKPDQCPTCGTHAHQKRGPRYTRLFKIQRNRCDNGHWFDTTREKI